MRRFIARLLAFSLLVAVVIGGVCLAEIAAEVRAYRRELVAPAQASALVCGDSQAGGDIDPEACPKFFNFSAHGRSLDQSYLAALDALDRNAGGGIKTVVFDVTPSAAASSMSCGMGEMGYAGKYWLLHYLHPRESLRDLGGGLVVARDNLVGRRLRHFWRAVRGKVKFESSLKGGFVTTDIIDKRQCPERYWKLLNGKAAEAKGHAAMGPEPPYASKVLDKVVALAHARGVEPVFITTPWNGDLRMACGAGELDAFTRTMSDFAKSRGCVYIDFLRAELADDLWGDGNHLNHAGAKVFTKMLAGELERRSLL